MEAGQSPGPRWAWPPRPTIGLVCQEDEEVPMFRSLSRLLARKSNRRASRSLRQSRVGLLLEVLEDRATPSATVGLSGHTLSIVDSDTTGHTINVSQTAVQNQFTVQADAGPVQTFSGVSSMKVDLGADNATLNLNNGGFNTSLKGDLYVTAGDGSSNVTLDFSTITGNVSVNEGDGTDSVVI